MRTSDPEEGATRRHLAPDRQAVWQSACEIRSLILNGLPASMDELRLAVLRFCDQRGVVSEEYLHAYQIEAALALLDEPSAAASVQPELRQMGQDLCALVTRTTTDLLRRSAKVERSV